MTQKSKIKILLVSTTNMNLGDTVIADNNQYLIARAMRHFRRPFEIFCYNIATRDLAQIAFCDAVVFAGGILKVTNEKFSLYIPEILQTADACGIPVFLNGIGVERFYEDNPESIALRDALNLPCVKGINVRDDMDTLKKDYVTNPDIVLQSVYDVAIWSRNTYRKLLPKKFSAKKNTVIGLGIAREMLFPDYGHPEIDRAFLLNFWKGLVKRLESDGYQWALFTNGDTYDERFCKDVLAYIGHGDKLPAPFDGGDLVRMIAGFRCVIGARMHSNIIAYAMGIPSVGFIWNQKLRFWGRKIGFSERFIEPEEMSVERVYQSFLGAMSDRRKTGPSYIKRRRMKKTLWSFLKKYAVKRKVDGKAFPVVSGDKTQNISNYRQLPVDRLMAANLGTPYVRYKSTNSLEAFRYSLAEGYRNFEVSLRLTSDKVLMCTKSFGKDLYHILNLPREEEELTKPISSEEFLSRTYYNRLTPITFEMLMKELAASNLPKDFVLLLYIGKPDEEGLACMLGQMMPLLCAPGFSKENFILRLETRASIEYAKTLPLNAQLAYHFTTGETNRERQAEKARAAAEYCASQGITFLTMREGLWHKGTAKACRDAQIKAIPCSYNKLGDAMEALRLGASYVGNHYYTVDYARKLIN